MLLGARLRRIAAPEPARRRGCPRGARSRRAGRTPSSPSRPRTATIDSSRSNGTISSASSSDAECARSTRRHAGPCRRSRTGATSRARADPASSHRAVREPSRCPSRLKSSFSTSRSWPCSSARASGAASTRRAASTGTFSNSYVTTSAPSASRSRSSADRRTAPTSELAHVAGARVGRRIEEAKAHSERCAGEREHAPELPAADAADEGRHADGSGAASTARVWLARYAASRSRTPSSRPRDDRGREERRVDRAGAPDRERADGHAGRHLRDREQRVEALQRLRLDRHAEHRQQRLRRRSSRAGVPRHRRPR